MGYIKFELSNVTDNQGRSTSAKIRRMYSDMEIGSYDLNRILHSLSAPMQEVEMWMVLDEGVLDRDKLYNREFMILDTGTLDIVWIG